MNICRLRSDIFEKRRVRSSVKRRYSLHWAYQHLWCLIPLGSPGLSHSSNHKEEKEVEGGKGREGVREVIEEVVELLLVSEVVGEEKEV